MKSQFEVRITVFERAKGMEMELSKEGLHRNARIISCKEEEDVFNALGLDFIPPELRENQGEIEVSAIHRLPRLVEERDIKGIFHVHSLYSDGKSSIRRLALTSKEMGFSYLGLSDHSQSARYAGGLSRERLQEQWEEID